MKDVAVTSVFDAVRQTTGISPAVIASATRRRDVFFARMIVAHHLRSLGMTLSGIGELMGNQSHATVARQCRCYHTERTPIFIKYAEKVESLLSAV